MKKVISIAVAILAVSFLFVSCTQKLQSEDNVVTAPTESEKEEEIQKEEEIVPSEEEQNPVYGTQLQDGVYPIEVKSSSSMFRIIDAKLTVENGNMSVSMTLSGKGYLRLYMGTGEQAEKASDEEYIYYTENSEGQYTYEVPIEALDKDTACAAWSIKKERWYDRNLVFMSETLPPEAFRSIANLENGNYEVDAVLTGGTGRADILSPILLSVTDNKTTIKIQWNSPYYDYMIV